MIFDHNLVSSFVLMESGGLEEFQEKHHSIVSMDANVVDPLTKPLLWPKYESHIAVMGTKYLKM